ncbi:transcription antitermination factor NusB [Candidatus Fermentibacteria bacterium]|nr:transcription antitermination factor NusB [Candidatus Fermentibacteria bacterium]
MTGTRHRMRKALLQAVYAWLLETDAPDEVLDTALNEHAVQPDDREYAHRLLTEIIAHRAEADSLLARVLEHWSLDRLGQVEAAVCYLALHELRAGEIPTEVILDEAVRLGKEYAGEESAHFVNGLLDAAAGIVRPDAASLEESP